MPRINMYVRNEDYESWLEIEDKPLFLHNAINMRDKYLAMSPAERSEVKKQLTNFKSDIMTRKTINETHPEGNREARRSKEKKPPVTYKPTTNWGA